MNPNDLAELVNLIQNGGDPDRAQALAQAYADWQRNLAKQAIQATIPQFAGCKNPAEILQITGALLANASPEMSAHVKALASKRFNELAFGTVAT